MTRPGWPLWLYAAAAGVVVAASVIGWAGSALASQRMTVEPGEGDCFATVRIVNLNGWYTQVDTLETEHGPVSISYRTVGGHGPGMDDRIEVVSLPEGVFARPMDAEIVDGQSLAVCLFEYVGG